MKQLAVLSYKCTKCKKIYSKETWTDENPDKIQKWICFNCSERIAPHVRDPHKFTDTQNAMLSGEKAWAENIKNRTAFGNSAREGYHNG